MSGIYWGLALYALVILGIGYSATKYKPIKSVDDFIVGNRFGSIVTGLASGSTLASGYAFIGLVAVGYAMGFLALYQAILAPIVDLICWKYIARKVRRHAAEHGALTTVEVLGTLRQDKNDFIKIIGGLIVGIFMFAYLGSNFIAAGKAASALDLNYTMGVVISSIIVILYTMIGGVTAVYWTDALQGFLMIFMCIFMPFAAIHHIGGVREFLIQLHHIDPILTSWSGGRAGWPLFVALWLWCSVAVGFLGQPQGIQKFITIEDESKIPGGALVAIWFNAIRQYFPLLLGLSCRVLFPVLTDKEMVTPFFIKEFFPNFMGGLMLAAIFAAIMSTTASLLYQGTSEIIRNVMQRGFLKSKNLDTSFYARASKVVTLIYGLGALVLALMKVDSVFYLTLLAWSGLAASFGPAIFAGFYWKKTTTKGILAGMITGMVVTFLWYNGGHRWFGLHEGLPSFIVAAIAVVVVSLMTQPQPSGTTKA